MHVVNVDPAEEDHLEKLYRPHREEGLWWFDAGEMRPSCLNCLAASVMRAARPAGCGRRGADATWAKVG
jgi:hypothetical protein